MKNTLLTAIVFVLVVNTCFCAELVLSNGGHYVGEVKNDMADGKGVTVYTNGMEVNGVYKNGIFVNGSVSYPGGNVETGEFQEGHLVKGTIKVVSDGDFKYLSDGEFDKKGNLKKGTMKYADGTIMEGVFADGYLKEGEIIYPDGMIDEGKFDKNSPIDGESQVVLEPELSK